MNPNPLTVLPPRARLVIYAVVWLAGVVLAAYAAAHGQILGTVAGVVGVLSSTLAAANVPKSPAADEPPAPPGSTPPAPRDPYETA